MSMPRCSLSVLVALALTCAVAAQTVPDFAATPTSGVQGLTVTFENLTTSDSPLVLYTWDFGDGSTTTLPAPTHVYAAPGSYTVSLEALPWIPPGQSPVTETKVAYITVAAGDLSVDFAATPSSGVVPLEVAFTPTLGGTANPTSWLWDFGDGATSTASHPTHTYITVGAHTVTLTVAAGTLQQVATKVDVVQVLEPDLQAAFILNPPNTTAGKPVQFVDTTTGGTPDTWLWDFGDGSTSSQQHPVHAYDTAGAYDVTLQVGSFGVTETVSVPQAVQVAVPDLQPAFVMTPPAGGVAPLPVDFADASPNDHATEWYWHFGEGIPTHDSLQQTAHVYKFAGTFEVKFTVRAGSYSASTTQLVEVVEPQLVAGFEAFPRAGLKPLSVDFVDASSSNGPWTVSLDFGDDAPDVASADVSHVYDLGGWFTPEEEVQTIPSGYSDTFRMLNGIEVVDPAAAVALPSFGPSTPVYDAAPLDFRTADLNGDGLPDLVHGQGAVVVALQDGGAFVDPVFLPMTAHESWFELADMDADGALDIVVVDSTGAEVEVWRGDGLGGFAFATYTLVPDTETITWSVPVDADGDGFVDVAMGAQAQFGTPPRLRMAYGDGAGGFASITPSGAELRFVDNPAVVDVDGDGLLDLFGPALQASVFTARAALGDGSAFAGVHDVATPFGLHTAWDVGHVDGDGRADFVLGTDSQLFVVPGAAGGPSQLVDAGSTPGVERIRLEDVDGDGRDDILGAIANGQLVLGRWGGDGSVDHWTLVEIDTTEARTYDAEWVDMDADGRLDLLVPRWEYLGAWVYDMLLLRNLGFIGHWADIGGEMTGAGGSVRLEPTGDLLPGTPLGFTLTGAAPASPALLVLGLSDLLVPFRGGVLVPNPDAILGGFVTDAGGALQIDTTWPLGVPAQTPSWWQVWVTEGADLVGSNGLLAIAAE